MVVCLYVCPEMDWRPGCTLPSPYVSWDWLQRPRDPNEDEGMDVLAMSLEELYFRKNVKRRKKSFQKGNYEDLSHHLLLYFTVVCF